MTNTIIVKDMADYAAVNEVYRGYFGAHPPARYCIAAQLVRDEFLVEIASIAHWLRQASSEAKSTSRM